ncbi:MAG: sulfotransferase family protein [Candidatus Binatia bacterium]
MPRDYVTVVSGLPRSGTSMLMRMLEAGGIPALTDGQRTADDDNPLGYFELEAVKALPAEAAWLEDAAGRSVKVVSALLDKLPRTHRYRVIFLEREIEEVLASQRRMLERRGEPTNRVSDDAMASMFRKHVAGVLERAQQRTEVRLATIAHAEVLASAHDAARRLDEFLGGGLDTTAMAAAVDVSLWRQRASAPSRSR